MFIFLSMNLNLRFKLLENLGRNSYAIHLIQFMVIYALDKILPQRSINFISWLLMFTLVTLINYFLSIISYIFIGRKVQKFFADITKPKYI